MNGTKHIEQTVPGGPIRQKYLSFAFEENYPEVGYLGAANTAKSDALCAAINQSAIDYPGATLFLFRGELSNLRNTTMDKLLTKYSDLKDAGLAHNKATHIITWPRDERTGKQSKVVCFGVNSGDYVTKMKSFEPFRAFADEANECVGQIRPGEKLDFALMRCRQIVHHRFSYRERIIAMVASGALPSEQAGIDHFGISESEIDDHEIGNPYLKYCANDEGNDWMWNRLVNFYGDKPHPPKDAAYWQRAYGLDPQRGLEKWVHENVGITAIIVPASEVRAAALFRGVLIEHLQPDGRPGINDMVRVVHSDHVETTLGHQLPIGGFNVVLERLAIYGFMLENHSANERNILYHWMAGEEMRDQYMFGLTNTKVGLMHPQFSLQTHVLPQEPIPEPWPVEVWLDYNIDYPTAIFAAKNPVSDYVIFDEYEGGPFGAPTNASQILGKLSRHGIRLERVKFIADPHMWDRDRADPSKSVAREYQSAGITPLYPGNNDRDFGVDKLNRMLTAQMRPTGPGRWAESPTLWVMDNCKGVIYGTENSKGMSTITWEEWRAKKRDHIHDAIRYGVASIDESTAEPETVKAKPKRFRWRRPSLGQR